MALVRKNIQMSPELAKWYEDKSKEIGVSQSSLMTMALDQYIKQEKAMDLMGNMKQMLEDAKQLKKDISEE